MKIGELDQGDGGDVDVPTLVVAVDPLTAGQNLAHLGLRQILVLPQIADARIVGHKANLPS